jgi:hypothetical protein
VATSPTIGLLLLAILAAAAPAGSQGVSGAPASDAADSGQRQFVQAYMAAVSASDAAALRRLLHPAVLACIDDKTREFFDSMLARDLRARPTAGYRISRVERLRPDGGGGLWPADMFRYPVAPTRQIQIDFETGPSSSTTLVREIALSKGSWLWVLPCPNAKGVAFFREQQVKGQRQRAQAEQLAAGIGEPLRSEIRQLLAEQRRVEAIKKYREASGLDLTTAVQVIDVIQAQK